MHISYLGVFSICLHCFSASADSECSKNKDLDELGNQGEMSKNGWKIEVPNMKGQNQIDLNSWIHWRCGSETNEVENWYGWKSGASAGTISTILKGSGNLTIDFGNCWSEGEVKVYLDSKLMAAAPKLTKHVVKKFSFNQGALLEIKDEGANSIIRLNSITFECSATASDCNCSCN